MARAAAGVTASGVPAEIGIAVPGEAPGASGCTGAAGALTGACAAGAVTDGA